jgi:hypothetical protein
MVKEFRSDGEVLVVVPAPDLDEMLSIAPGDIIGSFKHSSVRNNARAVAKAILKDYYSE